MTQVLESLFVHVCSTGDVPVGEGRPVTLEGLRVAVFHTESGWHALEDSCPHRGGPLSDGILADQCVACPLHERRFDLATGAALSGGAPASAHRVVVRGDAVLIEAAPELGRAA